MNTIAIFKSEADTEKIDPYVEILEKNGQQAFIIPTLTFNYINEVLLCESLKQPRDFEGIIFTSPRAVEAVNKAISTLSNDLLLEWRNKKNYCVGESTANSARILLEFNTLGEESGNADALCNFILSCYPDGKCRSFLFPSSNKRRETIPKQLQENGLRVIEVVSYETISNPSLKNEWDKMVSKQGLPNILVFFSPSGVQFSHELIKSSYSSTILPKCIAIGPSTEKALIEANLPPCKVASKPNPESFYEAIKCIL